MTLDDIKGRTYANQADFWRDVERALREAAEAGYKDGENAAARNIRGALAFGFDRDMGPQAYEYLDRVLRWHEAEK